MIEENVINWIDLGEAKQPLSIYGQKIKMNFFKFLMKMKTYNHSFPALDYIFQFFYLFQILTLCLYGISGYEEKEGYYTTIKVIVIKLIIIIDLNLII